MSNLKLDNILKEENYILCIPSCPTFTPRTLNIQTRCCWSAHSKDNTTYLLFHPPPFFCISHTLASPGTSLVSNALKQSQRGKMCCHLLSDRQVLSLLIKGWLRWQESLSGLAKHRKHQEWAIIGMHVCTNKKKCEENLLLVFEKPNSVTTFNTQNISWCFLMANPN